MSVGVFDGVTVKVGVRVFVGSGVNVAVEVSVGGMGVTDGASVAFAAGISVSNDSELSGVLHDTRRMLMAINIIVFDDLFLLFIRTSPR